VDVDPREVPVEEAPHRLGRQLRLRLGQLRGGLADVALAVRIEVVVVHGSYSLDQHHRRALHPAARRVGEEQRDLRVALGVARLLRVAKPGGDADAFAAAVVVRRDRPGDRLAVRVDRRQLGGDEALEDLLDVLRQRGCHGSAVIPPRALRLKGRGGSHRPW
jgi:hypothetical protein